MCHCEERSDEAIRPLIPRAYKTKQYLPHKKAPDRSDAFLMPNPQYFPTRFTVSMMFVKSSKLTSGGME